MSPPTSENPWLSGDGLRGEDYDARFARIAATGADMHGEAALVEWLGARSVLDAGCGTGRVAIELASRGLAVIGVDLDESMLEAARRKAPDLTWVHGNLAEVQLGLRFDLAVMAGNVMIFLRPGDEPRVVANMAAHLVPSGLLLAGFSLRPGGLTVQRYDEITADQGLALVDRWATWDREPFFGGGDYAVSLHRALPDSAHQ